MISTLKRCAQLTALALVGLSLNACSLLVDFEQCAQTSDCPSGQVCQDSICEAPPSCTKRDDCKEVGSSAYCLAGTCTNIDTTRCTLGPEFASGENIIPIGAVMPLSGENGDKGRATIDGAVLAIEDINKAGGAGGTKFSLITCDSEYVPATAVQKAEYLNSIGIKATIGGFSSSETLEIANKVAIPKGMLLISPASTSPAISGLADQGLVWRTVASDALQAPAMGELIRQKGFQKIALVTVDSAYGDGFREALINYWATTADFKDLISDSDRFRALRYPAEGELPTTPINESLFTGNDAFKPDAIILIGSVRAHKIIADLEAGGIAQAETKPTWVLSEALRERSLLDDTAKYQDAWPRIIGTVISQTTGGPFALFKANYESRYTDRSLSNYPFADKAYDAAYLIALAFAAQSNPGDAQATALGSVLKRTISGAKAQLSQNEFNAAATALKGGGSVDLEGASGPLDFDTQTGDVFSSIGAWSVEVDAQNATKATFKDDGVLIEAN